MSFYVALHFVKGSGESRELECISGSGASGALLQLGEGGREGVWGREGRGNAADTLLLGNTCSFSSSLPVSLKKPEQSD